MVAINFVVQVYLSVVCVGDVEMPLEREDVPRRHTPISDEIDEVDNTIEVMRQRM
jgi:hypothetical protein